MSVIVAAIHGPLARPIQACVAAYAGPELAEEMPLEAASSRYHRSIVLATAKSIGAIRASEAIKYAMTVPRSRLFIIAVEEEPTPFEVATTPDWLHIAVTRGGKDLDLAALGVVLRALAKSEVKI